MGKVDGIVVELRDRQPPRLAYIETGATTLNQIANLKPIGIAIDS